MTTGDDDDGRVDVGARVDVLRAARWCARRADVGVWLDEWCARWMRAVAVVAASRGRGARGWASEG